MTAFQKTARNKIRRQPQRATYDQATVYQIIDQASICHVGIVQNDLPFVIPTVHARMGDELILHGAPASRLMQYIGKGNPVCITITHVDGLVLARSALHHSMNYRSVVIFGQGRLIKEEQEKEKAFQTLVEHIVPGRYAEVRGPNRNELNDTKVVAVTIDEASAKVRTGPPSDENEDYELAVWAGVIPLKLTPLQPIADDKLKPGIKIPDYITNFKL